MASGRSTTRRSGCGARRRAGLCIPVGRAVIPDPIRDPSSYHSRESGADASKGTRTFPAKKYVSPSIQGRRQDDRAAAPGAWAGLCIPVGRAVIPDLIRDPSSYLPGTPGPTLRGKGDTYLSRQKVRVPLDPSAAQRRSSSSSSRSSGSSDGLSRYHRRRRHSGLIRDPSSSFSEGRGASSSLFCRTNTACSSFDRSWTSRCTSPSSVL
jgi:hypothetical protein